MNFSQRQTKFEQKTFRPHCDFASKIWGKPRRKFSSSNYIIPIPICFRKLHNLLLIQKYRVLEICQLYSFGFTLPDSKGGVCDILAYSSNVSIRSTWSTIASPRFNIYERYGNTNCGVLRLGIQNPICLKVKFHNQGLLKNWSFTKDSLINFE